MTPRFDSRLSEKLVESRVNYTASVLKMYRNTAVIDMETVQENVL